MLVLDENLPASQRLLLRNWRIRFRFVSVDIATAGTDDENLIPVLHHLPQPTFFSLDHRFGQRRWVHPSFCLVWLDVEDGHAAEFIRRFLRHPTFATQALRMGVVARVHADGVTFWRARKASAESVSWPRS
jgi:hypothetical protein